MIKLTPAEVQKRYRERHPDYSRNSMKKRQLENRDRLNEIKLRSGCVDCGYNTSPAALQFDHVSGEKIYNIGSSTSRHWNILEIEIAKCVVRCANCHAVRTWENKNV